MKHPESARRPAAAALLLALILASPAAARVEDEARSAALPECSPEEAGFDGRRLARIDDAVGKAIASRGVPGAVVLVGRRGRIAYAKAFGRRAIEPADEPMTRHTVFDLASLTKPMATATSLMILLEQGKFRLSDPIVKHLPELNNHGKRAITIDHLLRHRAGLIADNPVGDFADGPTSAWDRIAEIELVSTPGERFLYSDVGFMILGKLVERLSGKTLDTFAAAEVFGPLGLRETAFRPIKGENGSAAEIAPTEPFEGKMARGGVHDPRARALGGVAGHAGLFGTADDIAVFAQTLIDGGRGPNGRRILAPLTVRTMVDPGETPAGQRRGLGWDVATAFSAQKGDLFGPAGFGHTGFTGTSLWVDLETGTFVVLLTNRVHPDGKAASPTALRSELATIVASAILDAPLRPSAASTIPVAASTPSLPLHPVLCGIDVLEKRGFRELRGKRVGLITNHTGRTRSGRSTIDAIFHAPEVKLVALFSPEHGIRGVVDAAVADDKDEATGLTIVSLYGKARKPTQESLDGVDVLVYDIQDIGASFYTYITTLGLALEAAREKGIPMIVLDRPNPIGGVVVSGPVRDPEFASFIAHHALPIRHGMTVGELAGLFNAERSIKADLTVIACEGWRRGDQFDQTDLVWVNPSPNMRSLTEALLYPGVCLLETTNLATGRGTDTPFEKVGAPWIDEREFAAALNGRALPGVRFIPIRFTPKERQFAGQECGGVQIMLTDRSRLDPLDLGIVMASVLQAVYPKRWEDAGFRKMVGDSKTHENVIKGRSLAAIRAGWIEELAEFETVRAKYLLYQ